ncbi:MAG: electron transfer flavoprotein subunit alpha/FixB family protein, partial [Burkholderiales bacterium]
MAIKILVVAEHGNDQLRPVTANAVAAAVALGAKSGGAEVHVLVAGHGAQVAAGAAATIAGVGQVIYADSPALADQVAEPMTAQVLGVCAGFHAIVFPATAFGKNIAPRVAATLDVSQISEVIEIISPDTFKRPIYAGNVIATVQSLDSIKIMTVRGTAFEAAGSQAACAIHTVAAVAAPAQSA